MKRRLFHPLKMRKSPQTRLLYLLIGKPMVAPVPRNTRATARSPSLAALCNAAIPNLPCKLAFASCSRRIHATASYSLSAAHHSGVRPSLSLESGLTRSFAGTVKPPYNDMTYLADRIVIPKVSLYLVFVCKMHPKSKLGNDIIYLRPRSRN